jgi:predicted amidohydrolase YtcJ
MTMLEEPLMNLMSVLALAAFVSLAAAPVRAQTDFVLHNARIYTVDPDRPQAEAMAVGEGRILMVGADDDVLNAHPDATRLDAGGRTVIPGLIDAHAHLMGLGTSRLRVDLVGASSVDEVTERLRAFEEGLPADAWLTGRGWDQNNWPGAAFPTRADLDTYFPDRPVWLRRIDGHAAWANTAALRAAGLERLEAMPDPPGGNIVRDASGRITGVFIDAAMGLVDPQVPDPPAEERERALRLALEEAARYGLTGVHDAGADLETIDLYRRAIDEGWFGLRVYAMIGGSGRTLDHFCRTGPLVDYGDRLTVRSVKFYIDGALGSRGAALLTPYSDDPGNDGLLMVSPEAFVAEARRAAECGLQVNTHAIGDRGNRVVLDAYEEMLKNGGALMARHRIEHVQVVAPDDLPRFSELGVIAAMQPIHATSDMYWAEDRLGAERVRGAYAWRSLLDHGTVLAFGSDFPVEPVNPLLGFYAAITRQDLKGWPEGGWYPDQQLTRIEALRAFTLDAAYAAFQEEDLGSLTPGKHADFVVLSEDLMAIPASEIPGVQVVATYVGGEAVFGGLESFLRP